MKTLLLECLPVLSVWEQQGVQWELSCSGFPGPSCVPRGTFVSAFACLPSGVHRVVYLYPKTTQLEVVGIASTCFPACSPCSCSRGSKGPGGHILW